MEQKLPVLPKRLRSMLRVVYSMIRNGISKRKILLDLNMLTQRAKILGKNLQNHMFHHHHQWAAFATNRPPPHHLCFPTTPPGEYEFSCSTSPSTKTYPFSLFSFHKKQQPVPVQAQGLDMMAFNAAIVKAMEMIHSESASPLPELPGFGNSPMVRQLRITDSPFPLSSVDEDSHVDEAAEQFISRFYNDLKHQNTKGKELIPI